ncbi:Crp/Fnr family transcriptional regulator [Amycolatopsis sp. EV170708-02-1]|uniref:Crp/Fnr family transcriptional regulator n=1 Tax=Amycolatopsis sp. EV170708-02-1 TaxID=2919322 RepID=UPI001F0CBE24|nr:cyclic nucleotide-binding domain-containing protein [Amycolatopsis sp. EV170708-02-1]UMP03323.1 cyclic nucleotide-binding domain-containing protein [Amycolatopsis sp. EV170708-02-1]
MLNERNPQGCDTVKEATIPTAIADLAFFRRFSAEEISRVLRYGRRVTLPQGWPLMSEGTPGDVAYILLEGQLAIWCGRELTATLEPGSLVGEISLQQGTLRAATVSAATPVTVLRLSTRTFTRLIANSPVFARTVDEIVAHRTASPVSEVSAECRPGDWSPRCAVIFLLCWLFVCSASRCRPVQEPLVRLIPLMEPALRMVSGPARPAAPRRAQATQRTGKARNGS